MVPNSSFSSYIINIVDAKQIAKLSDVSGKTTRSGKWLGEITSDKTVGSAVSE